MKTKTKLKRENRKRLKTKTTTRTIKLHNERRVFFRSDVEMLSRLFVDLLNSTVCELYC